MCEVINWFEFILDYRWSRELFLGPYLTICDAQIARGAHTTLLGNLWSVSVIVRLHQLLVLVWNGTAVSEMDQNSDQQWYFLSAE